MASLPKGTKQRSNGTYERRFTFKGKRVSVYGNTLKELDTKEFEKRKELENNAYMKNGNITLNAYFKEWLQEREKHVKPTTLNSYSNCYHKNIAPTFGKRKVKDIEKREIRNYQNKEIKDGKSITLVNRSLLILGMVLHDCVNDEIILTNPATGIKPIKDDREKASETKHRALTEHEQAALMAEMKNDYYYEFVAFMLCTGMRFGEVAALRWSNVDEVNKVIHVKETITRTQDGGYTVGTPKSKGSERDIPMSKAAFEILQSAKDKNIIVNGKAVSFKTTVFFNASGGFVQISTVNAAITRAIDRLNAKGYDIERVTSHAMRDTFATRFIEQGGTPQTLKTILGHSTLSMTMDLYAHVLPNTKAEEMNRVQISV